MHSSATSIGPARSADELQVAEQRRVAQVVDRLAAEVDDEPGRRVDRALRRRRRVQRLDELDPAPVERHRAAEVRVEHLVVVAQVAGDLAGELGVRDDRRAGALGDVEDVAVVVLVAVGEQDRVGVDLVGRAGGLRVAGEERVDEHRGPAVLEQEAGMAQERDLHLGLLLAVASSSCASSSPTATPTSIPSRVSSATSVRTASSRSASSGRPRDRRHVAVVLLAEPAAALERLVEDALEAGRRVGDDLLGVREALGVAERLDRSVDLVGGVGRAVVGHGRAGSIPGMAVATHQPVPRRRMRMQAPRRGRPPARRRSAPDRPPRRPRRLLDRRRRGRRPAARRPGDRADRRLLHADRRRPVRLRPHRGDERADATSTRWAASRSAR